MEASEKKRNEEIKKAVVFLPFVGWILAVVFLVSEKDERLRWLSAYSLVLHAVVFAIYFLVVPVLRATVILLPVAWFLQGASGVGFVLVMLYMLVKTHEGKVVRLPLVAEWADKIVKESK